MKYINALTIAVTAVFTVGCACLADVAVGDNYADMISELGQPQGEVAMGDKTLYLYPAGSVTVAASTITEVKLKTPEQMEQDAKNKAESARQWEAHKEMMKERHHAKGLALKQRATTDPNFLAKSSSIQLAFWNKFNQDYPELDVTEIVTPLTERYAVEQAEIAKLQKLQEQEDKIANLEDRVEKAEQKADEVAKQPSYYAYYGSDRPYYPYYQPNSSVVVVNGGNAAVTPVQRYPYYNVNYGRYDRSGLRVNGSVGSVNFRYSSGGGGGGPYYWNSAPRSSGITVINTGGGK